jgi:hypothetical protein
VSKQKGVGEAIQTVKIKVKRKKEDVSKDEWYKKGKHKIKVRKRNTTEIKG